MIMRSRPANIRLINRRLKLSRLLLALSSRKRKDNYKNIPTDFAVLTMVTPYQADALIEPWTGSLVAFRVVGRQIGSNPGGTERYLDLALVFGLTKRLRLPC
jgi:hypothetical protein